MEEIIERQLLIRRRAFTIFSTIIVEVLAGRMLRRPAASILCITVLSPGERTYHIKQNFRGTFCPNPPPPPMKHHLTGTVQQNTIFTSLHVGRCR